MGLLKPVLIKCTIWRLIKIKVLGIDPGSTKQNPTGYAVIDIEKDEVIDCGCIEPGKLKEDKRLKKISKGFIEMLSKHDDITFYSYENQYGPSGKSLKTISQVIGAIRLAVFNKGILYYDSYTPNHIKKIVTGNGRANKQDVMDAIIEMYPELNPEKITKDMSDAVAIAHTCKFHILKEKVS